MCKPAYCFSATLIGITYTCSGFCGIFSVKSKVQHANSVYGITSVRFIITRNYNYDGHLCLIPL